MPVERRDLLMDTVLSQRVYGITALDAAEAVVREIERLAALWNRFDPRSLVSRLNLSAGTVPVPVDPDTASVLAASRELAERTGGCFDVTVLPLVAAWRRAAERGALPDLDVLREARALVGSRHLRLLPGPAAFLPLAGQGVDLGGIAKGFATDRARTIYLDHGVRHALINFGGNVLVLGTRPDGSPWRIGIQKPGAPRGECVESVEAHDAAVVTSGSYERFVVIDGRRWSHVLDPRTGWPVQGPESATVMSASATEADALAKAAMIMGPESAAGLFSTPGGPRLVSVDGRGWPPRERATPT